VKVADLVAEFLAQHVKHVFTVSGGADLHLIHAIWKRNDIKIICPQNEQAASFQADAYARLSGMGCALATSGPGATNLITGIATSYYDSVPVLYLTGQQVRDRLKGDTGVRQIGFQETPIVDVVKPITKYAFTPMNAEDVIPSLIEAVRIAKEGRPGPVLIDVPDDLQRAQIG
jgi:acetolactate synthase-1/2/3 large subunit